MSKWTKKGNKEDIIKDAANDTQKKLFKIRPAKKYLNLFHELQGVFVSAWDKGHRVDFNWLWSKGRKIYLEQQDDEAAVLKKHVIANFIKRYHLKLRLVQRNKKVPKEYFRTPLMKWHSTLRERLVRTGALQPIYDVKWRRFPPSRRFWTCCKGIWRTYLI